MTTPAHCLTCATDLSARNRSGYCRRHLAAVIAKRPGQSAKISQGLKRKLQTDPVLLERYRENARVAAHSPACVKARYERDWNAVRLRGQVASQSPEARAKAGRTLSATRMAWCPPHLRERYFELTRRKHIRAAEAREMILELDAAEVERLRRRMVG